MSKLKEYRFSLLIALSCVIIVAGIILAALLGFNTSPDKPKSYTVEVKYDVVLEISEKEAELEKLCESTFSTYGLSYTDKATSPAIDSSTFYETTDTVLTYTFASSADAQKVADAAESITIAAKVAFPDATIYAGAHSLKNNTRSDAFWRGAIAIAVGAIVALCYVAIRNCFEKGGISTGVSFGVAGLACCLHDALVVVGLFAITRFPVYTFAPILYAAVAAFVSVVLWVIFCVRARENLKKPENASLSGAEVIANTAKSSRKCILGTAGVFAAIVLLLGLIGVAGTMLSILPMLVAVAVPVYSTLLIGPEICVPIRKALDKKAAAKKGGYVGKKKTAETTVSE